MHCAQSSTKKGRSSTMLTVKDLLEIKSIEGIKIVAGESGINNEIAIVNIIENPDAFDWWTSNELLLSTGYIFKDNEELQNRIIQELAEINCAGLCIKVKRYFNEIPQNMIDAANKYGLPLLELPFGYTLSNLISIINEKATARYDTLNRSSLDVHNALFRIALEGGGLNRISAELAETINNPVVIVDREWNLLHYTDYRDNQIPLTQCLHLVQDRPVFPKEFTDTIPQNISEIKKSIKRIYHYGNGQNIKCRIMPVAVANYLYGYIVVLQTVRELAELDYIALEHSSSILALERIKAREIEEVKLKIRQDFFDDLLTGKITSPQTLQTLCDLHGLEASYAYYCMVVNIEPVELDKYEDMVEMKVELEQISKKGVELVYSLSDKADGKVTSFYRNNRIILLIGKQESKSSAISDIKSFAGELHELLSRKIKRTAFLIGIGRQYKTIDSLHKSFSEAHEAIRLMQRFNDQSVVSHFEDYSVYHFLDSNIKTPELESFFYSSLGPIYDHDHAHSTSFMITLENYFAYNRNVSEAAKAMFIHRNTFIYRIDKIKEILQTELKDSEELLLIQLALKIYRLLHKN